jgi:hypothetical protein
MYKELLDLGTELRGNVISLLATLVAAVAILSPFAVVYAASSPYSFTMQFSVVNGCTNGTFHTLAAGSAKLTGSTSAPGSSIPVQYELQREVFGFNPSYGSVNGGINTSFSNLTFPSGIPADTNFCIIVYRNSFDAITVTGSGNVHN